jgi:hypothetical protein
MLILTSKCIYVYYIYTYTFNLCYIYIYTYMYIIIIYSIGITPLSGTTDVAHMKDDLELHTFELREEEVNEMRNLL